MDSVDVFNKSSLGENATRSPAGLADRVNHNTAPLLHEVIGELCHCVLSYHALLDTVAQTGHKDRHNSQRINTKTGMANLPIQLLSYFTAIIGGLLMVIAVILPFWKEPDFEVGFETWKKFVKI